MEQGDKDRLILSLRLFGAWLVAIPTALGFTVAFFDHGGWGLLVGLVGLALFILVHPKRKHVRAAER